MDQFHRDVMHLLRFSLQHPATAAPLLFPMFDLDQIRKLYEIPLERRERLWRDRDKPKLKSLFVKMPDA